MNKGADGLIHSANIRAATRITNRPIACEVTAKPTSKENSERVAITLHHGGDQFMKQPG